ncbi:heavy-metal-associated domain-containing protein [Pelagibacterium lentulum]|uniref:Heavy metal transport/detoxification protein n=1 Tax=Pelagibacterium lentulum TaxID=2029865 RepID=A0A916VVM8_9HYPH|nr:heavy-metal-associated domain-containing protein [Pelagibacterium lentulum]GGA43421.1 heavy metal transport/detoxification protein [Pelagibacterium lentulum]
MHIFEVKDMTCGHCAGTIEKAVKTADPQATIEIDLIEHRVSIESGATASALEKIIGNAGYSPILRQN